MKTALENLGLSRGIENKELKDLKSLYFYDPEDESGAHIEIYLHDDKRLKSNRIPHNSPSRIKFLFEESFEPTNFFDLEVQWHEIEEGVVGYKFGKCNVSVEKWVHIPQELRDAAQQTLEQLMEEKWQNNKS